MSLPNLKIVLQNGQLGRVSQTADGVAGMILTGTGEANEHHLKLNKVYTLGSIRDLADLGVTQETNPLVQKEVSAFYQKAGEGAELYLLVVPESTTLSAMCSTSADAPIHRLIAAGKGRIRLVGLNRVKTNGEASTLSQGIEEDAVQVGPLLQNIAVSYASKINPFRAFVPAMNWNGATDTLYKPSASSFNRVGYVMASDAKLGDQYTAAIGQALGTAASVPVNYPISRVKNGVATISGQLTNGKTPEENGAVLDLLHDAGYIIYRTFVGRNGYYFNSDTMAAPETDDYSNLYLGRTIDKAMIVLYNAFIDEINETIEIDEEGNIPVTMCKYYEGVLNNAVAVTMQDEISSFSSYVDPKQNVLSSSMMTISTSIRPKGVLKDIQINLGFENPALKQ